MPTIKSLENQIANLRRQCDALDAEEFREKTLPVLRRQIGTAKVYRDNGYGSDSKFDTFRILREVVAKKGYATLIYEQCQIDSDGKPELSIRVDWARDGESGWRPCALSEYQEVRQRVLEQLENPTLAREHAKAD